jgi:hypothetical protein
MLSACSIKTLNRFSPLSNKLESKESQVSPPPVTRSKPPKPLTISSDKLKTLVIGDSITHSIRLKKNHPAIIHCLPGGRAIDVWVNLKKVLAKSKTGQCIESIGILLSTSAPTMLG